MNSEAAEKLGVNDVLNKLSRQAGGRDVNMMVFENSAGIKAKGPSTRIPGKVC